MPRAKRICPKPGCPKVMNLRYCIEHEREYEAKRGTREQRGYGSKHKAMRADWAKHVATGLIPCAKCGNPIESGQAWDLGHADNRSEYTGPEHAACNRADGGRKARLAAL